MYHLRSSVTLICLLVICSGIITSFIDPVSKAKSKAPNIIFILTDDQRWDALGYAGNNIIHTPHLDQLAREGLYFKNAFATTPICAASRATLFTGLYERTHDYTFGKLPLSNAYMMESYPYLLKKAGYQTGFVGKFGVKVNQGMEDSMFHFMKKTAWPYIKKINGQTIHLADINGNHAINFIKENSSKPFCLSLSFWSPHADDGAKEQYFWPSYCDSLYTNVRIPLPATAKPEFFDALPDFLKKTMNRERWYWRFDSTEKYQRMVKGYYRMISGVDSVIGRIRAALDDQGIADNTIIVFLGDNGYFLGDRGYADKWLMYEQSIRVPMIIYDPRQPASRRRRTIDDYVLNVDVTPTILQLANVSIPKRYQGVSLTGFINGKPDKWRTSIFCEHRLEGNPTLLKTECFRDKQWKFIRYEDHPDFFELYNLKDDPDETKNLALDKKYDRMLTMYRTKCDSIARDLLSARVSPLH
ncbi:MAG: sulfatase [bacterium]|jgi:arylsulfatase A-like enzyme